MLKGGLTDCGRTTQGLPGSVHSGGGSRERQIVSVLCWLDSWKGLNWGKHRLVRTPVLMRSWCALRKISLSFCVFPRTLVSIGVPFLIARGASCVVLACFAACFAGCFVGSIPPASIKKLLFRKDLGKRNLYYAYFSGNSETIHRPKSPREPFFWGENGVTTRGGGQPPRLQGTCSTLPPLPP